MTPRPNMRLQPTASRHHEAPRLKRDVDMTSEVKFEDSMPATVSMPLMVQGQGRGEASNRDG